MIIRRLSRLLCLSLIVILILSACGRTVSTTGGTPTQAPVWTGEITVWDGPRWSDAANTNKYFWLEQKKAEFEAKHPGVTIKIVQVPWAEMEDKLNVAIAGKAWPDLGYNISNRIASVKNIQQGVIEPVDGVYTKEEWGDFFPNTLTEFQYEGHTYGIPVSSRVHTLLLNLDIFKEKGVEPPKDGKWTYDQFVEKMQKLTGNNKFGVSTYIMPSYYEAWPFIMMDGGRPLSSDMNQYTFDSPEAISGLQKFLDLKFKYKVAPADMGTVNVGDAWKQFAATDKRLMAVQPWNSWAIASAQKDPYKMNFTVAEYPSGSTGKSMTVGDVLGWVMFKQKDEAKSKMVAEFMKSLSTTDEIYTTAKYYGVFASRKSSAEKRPFQDNPQMEMAQKIAETAVIMPRHPQWAKIDEAIQKELQLAVNGTKTAEQALKDARKVVDPLLKK